MFRSEEEKMRVYRSNLGREAKNQFKQGEKLDEYLLYEKGIESQEKGTTKFAEAIGEQIGKNMRIVRPTDIIKDWASKATSDELDDNIVATSKNKPKAIAQPNSDEPIRAKSKKMPKSIAQPAKPKGIYSENPDIQARKDYENTFEIPYEQEQMEAEDIRSRLAQLNADQDYALRVKFNETLNELKSAAKVAKDVKLLQRLQEAINNQRMADAFEKFSQNAITDAFARKIQRNLKALMTEKKVNQAIANKQVQKTMNDLLSGVEQNAAATTIQQRMAHLRAMKAKKRSNSGYSITSSAPTSTGSEGPLVFDAREFNQGRSRNDTNAELNTFTDLLSAYDNSKGKRRKEINQQLNNIITRQTNTKIVERMKNLKSAFHR